MTDTLNLDRLQRALEHQRKGEHAKAEALLRDVLAQEPDHPDALHLLGLSLHGAGQHEAALELIERAIAVRPGEAMFHANAGAVALALGAEDRAADHQQRAIAADPGYADAYNNLAVLRERQGRLEEAVMLLEKAVALEPEHARAYGNLGNVLRRLGRFEDALEAYRRALRIDPTLAEVYTGLGNALRHLERPDDAVAAYREAIRRDSGRAEAHCSLGAALAARGLTEEAAEALDRAIALRPDPRFRIIRAGLMPVIPASREEIRRWRRHFAEAFAALRAEGVRLDSNPLDAPVMAFYLAYHGENDRDLMTGLARFYESACPDLRWTAPHCRSPASRRRGSRVRVGFLSRYFGEHAVAWMVQGLLRALPRDRFEVLALTVDRPDVPVSDAIRSAADGIVALPYALDRARRRVAELELDILVYADIGMEAFSYFLAFARLAPVQCVTWGHPDTTGLASIDYYLSNDLAEPPDAQDSYSERLVRLAGVQSWYARPERPAALHPRVSFGLPEEATLYLCPQSLFKIHPDMDRALAEILRRDRKGCLVLFHGRDPMWAELLLRRLRPAMAEAIERVRVLPHMPPPLFLNVLAQADLVLDTWPFGAGNTSYQSFAFARPVVTLPGRYIRGRGVLAHYRHMGIEGCIAATPEEYADIAVRLGTDPDRRREVSEAIAARADVLFEDEVVVRSLAKFLEEVAP